MNKFYFSFLLFLFVSLCAPAQTCYGKHNAQMVLLTTQNGVEFYYQITHCVNGDEVLLKIINTNRTSKSITCIEQVSSANQVWKSTTPQTFQIAAQSTIQYTQTCSANSSALELVGNQLFPNEPKTQLLAFELFNIIID